MIYPDNFEQRIGFEPIRQLLSDACYSPLGRAFVDRIQFLTRFDLVQKLLNQVAEFTQILQSQAPFPSEHYHDVSAALNRAALPGAFLDVQAFYELKMSLRTAELALRFFQKAEPNRYLTLRQLGQEIYLDKGLSKALDRVVDDEGAVRDNASPELLWIKRELIELQSALRKQIGSIMRQAKADGYVPDDAEVTIRNGRLVIPVLAEHKRRVKGLIHDESATGHTVFIEPEAIFERNNDIKDLENAYHRELIKILTQLTDLIRPQIPELRKVYQFLGLLDFIRAKARIAGQMGAVLPQLQKQPLVRWKNARHPVLEMALRKQERSIVPLDIQLTPENHLLLISGPNAGGKSVALKSVGLLQYMLQCGLLIPVEEGSESGIFEDILLDIGDQQSIENDLSTYSSHLTSMKYFLRYADRKSLVLIDEFGTGTEPLLGGAIAEAVLADLHRNKVWGVITTHYTNLKNLAEKTPGIINAAMRYDPAHLQPLYKLEIGQPGSSFAIEIAQKIGLPQSILERASKLIGHSKIRYDRLLEELQVEKNKLESLSTAAANEERRLKSAAKEYEDLIRYLENSKTETLREAKRQAKELLRQANQQVERAVRTIQESKADKEKTRQVREDLKEFEQVNLAMPALRNEAEETGDFAPGDMVTLIGQDSSGKVLSVKGKKAEVMFGDIKSIVRVDQLERARRKPKYDVSQPIPDISPAKALSQRLVDFNTNLDVRGYRAEDALTQVMSFIDDASMLGMGQVKIVHGKGNGILRHLLRDYLRTRSEVASLENEHPDRGGDGATLVVLK